MSFLILLTLFGVVSAQAPNCGAESTGAPTEAPCGLHMERVDCPGCERTCANLRNPPHVCPDFCVVGGVCVCAAPFYLNAAGDCVPANQCPRVLIPNPGPKPGPPHPLPE